MSAPACYKFVEENVVSSIRRNNTLTFTLWSINNNIRVETVKLVYPWTSLVAEIGGTLGLFVGFSFMMVWDGMERLWEWRRKIREFL